MKFFFFFQSTFVHCTIFVRKKEENCKWGKQASFHHRHYSFHFQNWEKWQRGKKKTVSLFKSARMCTHHHETTELQNREKGYSKTTHRLWVGHKIPWWISNWCTVTGVCKTQEIAHGDTGCQNRRRRRRQQEQQLRCWNSIREYHPTGCVCQKQISISILIEKWTKCDESHG